MSEITYNYNDRILGIKRAKVDNNNALNVSVTSESGNPIETTPFNDLVVANKTTILELKSVYGLSQLRDITVLSGSGLVQNEIGDREFTISVSNSASYASLESAERGRYIAGKSSEYGVGARLGSATYTGDTVAKWGAINADNGMYFGQDSTGVFVAVLDSGSESRVYQTDWNVDKVDGSTASGLDLDVTAGQVYNQQYTWYGYGVIDFAIYFKTIQGLKKAIVHRYVVDGQTSIANPNLPIGGRIEQTNTTDTEQLFIGGRQFSILGDYKPTYRATSDYIVNKSVPTTGLIPILSFKQKEPYHRVNGKVDGFEILSDEDILVEIVINTTLTGASFGNLTRKIPSETAFESDTSATSFSGGDMIYRTIIPGGQGNSKSVGVQDLRDLILDLPEESITTLTAQSLGAIASIDCVFRLREEW